MEQPARKRSRTETRGEAEERIALQLALAESLSDSDRSIAVRWMVSGEEACSVQTEVPTTLNAFKTKVVETLGIPAHTLSLFSPGGDVAWTENAHPMGNSATAPDAVYIVRSVPVLDGSRMVTFGRYHGYTYSDLVLHERGYCDWVLRTASASLSCHEKLRDLAEYIQSELPA